MIPKTVSVSVPLAWTISVNVSPQRMAHAAQIRRNVYVHEMEYNVTSNIHDTVNAQDSETNVITQRDGQ